MSTLWERVISGALVSAGFEVSATVVKTKELDEAYVCHDDDKPDFNTGRTTAARYVLSLLNRI